MNENLNIATPNTSSVGTADIPNKTGDPVASAKTRIKNARGSNSANASAEVRERIEAAKIVAELEKLYSADSFAPIVSAPSNLAVMITGRKLWELSKGEVHAMASSASTAAKYFLSTDPKWVALSMFLISTATIYGTRIALHIREVQQEKKDEKEST